MTKLLLNNEPLLQKGTFKFNTLDVNYVSYHRNIHRSKACISDCRGGGGDRVLNYLDFYCVSIPNIKRTRLHYTEV